MYNALSYFSPELSAVLPFWWPWTGLIKLVLLWVPRHEHLRWRHASACLLRPSWPGAASHERPVPLARVSVPVTCLILRCRWEGCECFPLYQRFVLNWHWHTPYLSVFSLTSFFFLSFFLPSAVSPLLNVPCSCLFPAWCPFCCIAVKLRASWKGLRVVFSK